MLFARDKSQMCNNLLQFAHVYAWAREHGRSVMSMRFSYKYKYFKISRSRFVSFPLYLCAKWLAALRLLPTASFKYEDCDAAALEQKMLSHRHIVVSGWYARWYDLFLKYRDEICDLFTIDPQYTRRVTEWMTEQESAAETTEKPIRLGVHIRRGDYAEWHGGQFYYSDEVYADFISRFISLMPGRRVEVYIAGNDPNLSLSSLTLVAFPTHLPLPRMLRFHRSLPHPSPHNPSLWEGKTPLSTSCGATPWKISSCCHSAITSSARQAPTPLSPPCIVTYSSAAWIW